MSKTEIAIKFISAFFFALILTYILVFIIFPINKQNNATT